MQGRRRVRPVLLVLLWIWAVCIFMIVDLFRNVEAFESVRPRARTYRAMRYAAHDLVGEPYYDGDFVDEHPASRPSARRSVDDLSAALARVRRLEQAGSTEILKEQALEAEDSRVRILAMRALARRLGHGARPTLLKVLHNPEETDKVRANAACFLGHTGDGALNHLGDILQSNASSTIQEGALAGLAAIGSVAAVARIIESAEAAPTARVQAARRALAKVRNPAAIALLELAARDTARSSGTRVAACRALAASRDPVAATTLARVLADERSSPELRTAAVEALGRMGNRDALPAVAAACSDPVSAVAGKARIARTRLEHIRCQ